MANVPRLSSGLWWRRRKPQRRLRFQPKSGTVIPRTGVPSMQIELADQRLITLRFLLAGVGALAAAHRLISRNILCRNAHRHVDDATTIAAIVRECRQDQQNRQE